MPLLRAWQLCGGEEQGDSPRGGTAWTAIGQTTRRPPRKAVGSMVPPDRASSWHRACGAVPDSQGTSLGEEGDYQVQRSEKRDRETWSLLLPQKATARPEPWGWARQSPRYHPKSRTRKQAT